MQCQEKESGSRLRGLRWWQFPRLLQFPPHPLKTLFHLGNPASHLLELICKGCTSSLWCCSLAYVVGYQLLCYPCSEKLSSPPLQSLYTSQKCIPESPHLGNTPKRHRFSEDGDGSVGWREEIAKIEASGVALLTILVLQPTN